MDLPPRRTCLVANVLRQAQMLERPADVRATAVTRREGALEVWRGRPAWSPCGLAARTSRRAARFEWMTPET